MVPGRPPAPCSGLSAPAIPLQHQFQIHSSLLCFAMLALDSVLRRHNMVSFLQRGCSRGGGAPSRLQPAMPRWLLRHAVACGAGGILRGSSPLRRVHPHSRGCTPLPVHPAQAQPASRCHWGPGWQIPGEFQQHPREQLSREFRRHLAPIPLPCKPGAFLERFASMPMGSFLLARAALGHRS